MIGNLQVFLGREMLNKYAQGLKDTGPLLWIARGGLLTVFLVHIGLALRLKLRSRNARPIRYQHEDTVQASWVSQHMVLTGLVILAFVIFHLAHYTLGLVGSATTIIDSQSAGSVNFLDLKETYFDQGVAKTRHDVYSMVIHGFRSLPVSILYIVAQVLLGLHLLHGAKSVFQTFGLNHGRWNMPIRLATMATTAAIVVGNIAMPLAVYFRLLKLPGE
jgi:succinate dehydrogenase / fumarate reductase cytochrome b subunit